MTKLDLAKLMLGAVKVRGNVAAESGHVDDAVWDGWMAERDFWQSQIEQLSEKDPMIAASKEGE